jgi:hypothetical protein
LSSAEKGVYFDLDGNGVTDHVAWTAPNTQQAFLALDHDGSGRIDSGRELFGDHTPLSSGAVAKNGFEALAEYDDNHDGRIDDVDSIWRFLLLWFDTNHNGVSETAELLSIAESAVSSVDLNAHWTGRRDSYGNVFRYESTIRLRPKTPSSSQQTKPLYDIFFRRLYD